MLLLAAATVKGQKATSESKNVDSASLAVSKAVTTTVAVKSPDTTSLPKFEISESDLQETIADFKTGDPARAVDHFKAAMPAPVTDVKTREGILQQLPEAVRQLKIEDAELAAKFQKVVSPVLTLYGREQVYDVVIFRHPTPVMFSDSGVVLVVSTGMIERSQSDDELLGFVAHEVAHEYYARYSIYSKYLFKIIAEGGNETALKNKLAETLALIELQCDAFAASTLAYLNYNPLAFIESLERISRDFSNHGFGFHPPDRIRRELVEQITPRKVLRVESKVSGSLQDLKNSLR